MSEIRIVSKGREKFIDLSPVEELLGDMEAGWRANKFSSNPKWLDALRALDRDQLEHMVIMLAGLTNSKARQVAFSFTKKHVDMVESMHKLRETAKENDFDLWPELEEPFK